jgi:hypothetical protein
MTDQDAIDFVGYLIGSFAVGYAIGFLTVTFKKLPDQI